MTAASIRHAIQWIAVNDEPTDLNETSVAGYISTCLVADIFNREPAKIAAAVVRVRRAEANERLEGQFDEASKRSEPT